MYFWLFFSFDAPSCVCVGVFVVCISLVLGGPQCPGHVLFFWLCYANIRLILLSSNWELGKGKRKEGGVGVECDRHRHRHPGHIAIAEAFLGLCFGLESDLNLKFKSQLLDTGH
jgi:hypothetical protein